MGIFTATFHPIVLNRSPHYLRLNTRLWLTKPNLSQKTHCLGAVIGLNPGSASPYAGQFGQTDSTMNFILASFREAFKNLNRTIPDNCYVQMLNTFYLKEHDSNLALQIRVEKSIGVIDPEEQSRFPFLWFAWGKAAKPEDYARFLIREEPCCWMDEKQNVFFEKPTDKSVVRHPLFSQKTPRVNMISQMLDRFPTE
ncbi:MAG: hypothetical protein SOT13_05765 [Candidatus Aphodousia sp.]|nr:hypothetical protein [Sutterella sp.]MDY2900014.1 hypothetical protein [Candidatus Aphodousia sp.]